HASCGWRMETVAASGLTTPGVASTGWKPVSRLWLLLPHDQQTLADPADAGDALADFADLDDVGDQAARRLGGDQDVERADVDAAVDLVGGEEGAVLGGGERALAAGAGAGVDLAEAADEAQVVGLGEQEVLA